MRRCNVGHHHRQMCGHCTLGAQWFRVLFREQGILSFFHAGKITTHHEKILRFHCSYFRPCVCVPLFGPGGPIFKVHTVISIQTWMMQQVVGRFHIFVAAIAGLCVCAMQLNRSHVKIPHFRCGYFQLVCVCVCMYVMRCTTRQSCENSMLSLRLFLAYMCVCLLCFVFGPGWAGFEVLVNCGYFRI